MESKKTYRADLSKKRFLFFNVGLIVALLLSILAFSFKIVDETRSIDLTTIPSPIDPLIDVPITTNVLPPPPPRMENPPIKEIRNDEIPDPVDIHVDTELPPSTPGPELPVIPEVEPEDPDAVFTYLQESAAPEGGLNSFYQFVAKKIRYPAKASRTGIEGRVYVEFIVEKDGTLTGIKAITGIGAGCDEEAERVIALAPKWKPGNSGANLCVRSWSFPSFLVYVNSQPTSIEQPLFLKAVQFYNFLTLRVVHA